jgi:hypothetical protein
MVVIGSRGRNYIKLVAKFVFSIANPRATFFKHSRSDIEVGSERRCAEVCSSVSTNRRMVSFAEKSRRSVSIHVTVVQAAEELGLSVEPRSR